jgi:hypothetical protein
MLNLPAWVYILFILVFYIGLKRCYDSVIRVDRLALLPVILLIFGLNTVNSLFGIDFNTVIMLFTSGISGILLGFYHVKDRLIQADKTNRLIKIPGDFSMLILVLTIFLIEFYIRYAFDAHWMIADTLTFKLLSIIMLGNIMGITMGRNICYFYKYHYLA